MKLNFLKYIISLTVALFLFSCSEKLPLEEMNLNVEQEEIFDNENFVSSKQALEIAEKFLSKEPGATTRAFTSAKVETVRDVENSNTPVLS